ncbi:MAG: uncharacterized protein A8A55_0785 [Amphiamblys sp. WSBS2006]|nr:MAG: uncharacterized protein A8A55_0785 [Amphiamblys sp. WSBS2006]
MEKGELEQKIGIFSTMAAKPTPKKFSELYNSEDSLPRYDEVSVREELPVYTDDDYGEEPGPDGVERWFVYLFTAMISFFFPIPFFFLCFALSDSRMGKLGAVTGFGLSLVFIGFQDNSFLKEILGGVSEYKKEKIIGMFSATCLVGGYFLFVYSLFCFRDVMEG